MRNFKFTLERVRDWREKQLRIEEGRLEGLFAERTLIQDRLALLEREVKESAAIVNRKGGIAASELQAVDAFRRHAAIQRGVIGQQLAGCESRIAEQQLKILEARRRFELLDHLKNKKWKAWNAELAREIEMQAGDLYLAKWKSRAS